MFSHLESSGGYAALFAIGIVVSFVNSISGGGSVLSLPLLILLGLPSAVANGTNRIGVLCGSIGSLIGFRSHGKFLPALTWQVGWPAALGSVVGSLLAVSLPDKLFNPILGLVILFVVLMTFRQNRGTAGSAGAPTLSRGWVAMLAYVAIGFYGGFIQAGSGLIMIYVFGKLSNLDIFHINALKVSNTILFITVSLVAFVAAGKIHWPMALALGLGNAVGGWLGSHWQIKQGEAWVKRFLVLSGVALAGKLFWDTWRAWSVG